MHAVVRGSLLHARGEVGDVAEDVVLHARLADDAGEDVAVGEADARLHRSTRRELQPHVPQLQQDSQPKRQGPQHVLVRILRDAHLRHQTRHREVPVPHGSNFRHAALLRHLVDELKVVLEETQHRLWLDVLAHLRKADNVDEYDRDARVVPRERRRRCPPVVTSR